MTSRSLPVPDGLSGMRVDAGLARLLGLSRTAAAALAEEGAVLLDGVAVTKSEKLTAGTWLEVTLPEPKAPPENRVEVIEGMKILYADDDLVAVDKPAGVAAHASVGWTGPTVLGGLAAAGFAVTTGNLPWSRMVVIPSPTTTPLRRSWRPACSTYTWKPVARTRFECTSRR
ncbi:Probable pseudouridine synthase RluD [Mycobacteroides abscessus subsp. abscessus]|nr:Probable pseudouridine synthase RluD [Mycobacteroides abscessus subsp. abscessus]